MTGFFYFYGNGFLGDENNRNLNNLFQKFCSPSKVPIWTILIFRNTIKRSRMFNQLLLTQNVQFSIVFHSVKSIIDQNKICNSFCQYCITMKKIVLKITILSLLSLKILWIDEFMTMVRMKFNIFKQAHMNFQMIWHWEWF